MNETTQPQPTRRGFFGVVGAIAAALAWSPRKAPGGRVPAINLCVWSGGTGYWDDAEGWRAKRVPCDGDSALIPCGRAIMRTKYAPVYLRKITVLGDAQVLFPSRIKVAVCNGVREGNYRIVSCERAYNSACRLFDRGSPGVHAADRVAAEILDKVMRQMT